MKNQLLKNKSGGKKRSRNTKHIPTDNQMIKDNPWMLDDVR